MSITYGDRLIDAGYHDISPEQERELEAREECQRRGLEPDEVCADGGVLAWMVVDQEIQSRVSHSAYHARPVEMTQMIDEAEVNIREDYRVGAISKEQFQKELLIVARARQQERDQAPPPAERGENEN